MRFASVVAVGKHSFNAISENLFHCQLQEEKIQDFVYTWKRSV